MADNLNRYRLLKIADEHQHLAMAFMSEYKTKKYGKNVLGVPDDTFYGFIYDGKMGELVFKAFLDSEHVDHKCPDILKPHPGYFNREGSDFELTKTNETVDVKTTRNDHKIRLLVRDDQFRARRHDVYVGQRIGGKPSTLECWGYVTGSELANVPPSADFGHGPCRYWLLSDLHPIDEFVLKARGGVRF